MRVRWAGQAACCIASGPSLTAEDCEAVRAAGLRVIAVNNSWERAPFCDVLYAGDYKWWKHYRDGITVQAERWTCNFKAHAEFGINLQKGIGPYNSGLRAIELAAMFGAARIVLLGYDCMPGAQGNAHWHPDHDTLSNPNRSRMVSWNIQFTRLAVKLRRTKIINCSRRTALKCFPRATLADALKEVIPNDQSRAA